MATPPTTDRITDLDARQSKALRATGKILSPCPATLRPLIAAIPAGRIATLTHLRSVLAEQHGVSAVCPFTCKVCLKHLAAEEPTLPVWRVLSPDGRMLKYLPGGASAQAERLESEGHTLARSSNVIRLLNYRRLLAPLP